MLVLLENIKYNFKRNQYKNYYVNLEMNPNLLDLKIIELIMDTKGINFILKFTPELFKLAIEENINTIYLSGIKNNVSSFEDGSNPLLDSIKYMKGLYIDNNINIDLIELLNSLKHKYKWDSGRDSTLYEYIYEEGLSGNQKLIVIKDKNSGHKYIELHDSHGEILFSKDENQLLNMLNLIPNNYE